MINLVELFMTKNYLNGVFESMWEEYYKDGRLKIKKMFNNRLLDGPYEEYFENGKLKSTTWIDIIADGGGEFVSLLIK